MRSLLIEPTKSTPKVFCSVDNRVLYIEGQSYPENAFKFYEPVFQWIKEQLDNLAGLTLEVNFYMPYINTSSSKCVMMLLDTLENAYKQQKKVAVKWRYDVDNEMALECAEEFKEDFSLPFDLEPIGVEI